MRLWHSSAREFAGVLDVYAIHGKKERRKGRSLLPKEGKDTSDIKNWRPLTLSNCDAKIKKFFKTLYKGLTARIIVNGHLSGAIQILRGVKQGDARVIFP